MAKTLKRTREGVYKNSIRSLREFRNIHRKTPVLESLFTKVTGLNACNFIERRLPHRCFPVKFPRILRTSFFKRKPLVAASYRFLNVSWVLPRRVNRKFRKNYYLKIFFKYLIRLICHCRINNLKKFFNFFSIQFIIHVCCYLFCVWL